MSEVRCPMCSKPNPEDAEVCEFCGARIKPLYIEPESRDEAMRERPSPPPPDDQTVGGDQESDWLSRMRGDVEGDEGEGTGDITGEDDLPERGSTDLLGRFRGLGLADEEEETSEDIPRTPTEEHEDEDSLERGSTDLLGRFRGLGLAPEEEQPGEDALFVGSEYGEEGDEEALDAERGSTDLLGRLSDLGLSGSTESVLEADLEKDEGRVIPEEGKFELEWEEEVKPDVTEEPRQIADELSFQETEEEVPDWLSRVRERKIEDAEAPEKIERDEDWLSGLEEGPPLAKTDVEEPQDELEKIPPFIEYESELEKSEETLSSEPFIEEADLSDESDSLEDLFKDLEGDVAAVERIASEEDELAGLGEGREKQDKLDEIFSEDVDDTLLEEISISDKDIGFEPMEIEKGTSPLQDLFEELDEKLQTGELPALEPEIDHKPESDEDIDAALEKLLEEFDEQTIADAGLYADEIFGEEEEEGDRDHPIEEIFSDFQVAQEQEPQLEDLFEADEVVTEGEVTALEGIGGLDTIVGTEEEEFEGIFEGVEAPSLEDIAPLEEVFAEDERLETSEVIPESESAPDVEELISAEALLEGEPSPAIEPPSDVDIAAIEKLFGDIDSGPVEEPEATIDSGVLREINGEAPDKDAFTESLEALGASEWEIAAEDQETEGEFEAAEIGPRSLAPGSDQLAAGADLEDVDEEEVELVSTPPTLAGIETSVPTREELAEHMPSWLTEEISEGEISSGQDEDLPHVPALIMEEEELDLEEFGEDFLAADASAVDMPSWLEDLGADIDEEELTEEGPEVELARAKLPPWLEAMRPLETFRVEPEVVEEEEEEITEAAGPLAGLRGVLLAEPVVAMPHAVTTGAAALDVTDRHLKNTEILRQMISEEELEQARPEEKAVPLPVARWIISLLLVLAVIVPSLLGIPSFKEPFLGPYDLNPFLSIMNSIPLGQPALLVYDYEPGFSPEIDAVAGAMVEDLIARGQPLVSLSSRSTGSLLADRMILRIGSDRELVNGVDYLHLGYLPGGPTGIQLFAASPRSSLANGFRPPEEQEEISPWSTPILSEVHGISDFSAVAVITSNAETARNWIEQLTPYLGNTPLVLVATAGVEPMVRPYYESQNPQIQGILTGIRAGVKYEVWNGTLSDATHHWNAFGSAILVAELILLGGMLYGASRWFMERRLSMGS